MANDSYGEQRNEATARPPLKLDQGFFRVPPGVILTRDGARDGVSYTRVLDTGEYMTAREWLNLRFFGPLRAMFKRNKASQALRERAIDYALRGKAEGYSVVSEAKRIADYIREG